MTNHIQKREARLLRREAYLRRTRHVAFWLGIMVIVMPIVLRALNVLPANWAFEHTVWPGLFSLVLAYNAHLKLRHIKSIKLHRDGCAA